MRYAVSWGIVGALMLSGCFGSPGGQVPKDSRSAECSAELLGALGVAKRDLGFDYPIAPTDGETLMNTGEIVKRYARDGTRVSLSFGLEAEAGGCNLLLYKMTRNAPGQSTTTGSQGGVPLTECTCVAGES